MAVLEVAEPASPSITVRARFSCGASVRPSRVARFFENTLLPANDRDKARGPDRRHHFASALVFPLLMMSINCPPAKAPPLQWK